MAGKFTIKSIGEDGLHDVNFNIQANERDMKLVGGLTKTPVFAFEIMCVPKMDDDGRTSFLEHEGQNWIKTDVFRGPTKQKLEGDYCMGYVSMDGGGKRKKKIRKSKKRKSKKRKTKRRS